MDDKLPWETFSSSDQDGSIDPSNNALNVTVQGQQPVVPEAPKEAPRDHIQALLEHGASYEQIATYSKANGVDPSRIVGLKAAIDFRDNPKNAGAAPSQVYNYDDAPKEQPKPVEADNQLWAGLKEAANGFSVEILNPLAAAGDALIPGVGHISTYNDPQNMFEDGVSFSDAYHHNLQALKAEDAANQAAYPTQSTMANLGGAILSPINKVAAPVAGAGRLANAGRLFAGGATYGVINGAATSNADDLTGVVKDAATRALTDGATTVVAAPVLGGLFRGGATVANRASGGRLNAWLDSRAVANGINTAPTSTPSRGAEIIDSAERLSRGDVKIEPNAPMVGGRLSKMLAGGSDATLLGGRQIDRSMTKMTEGSSGSF